MKTISNQVITSIEDLDHFIHYLKELGHIKDNKYFFISDIITMYLNVNIEVIALLILVYKMD